MFFEIEFLQCSPGWPQSQDLPASASQVLGLNVFHHILTLATNSLEGKLFMDYIIQVSGRGY